MSVFIRFHLPPILLAVLIFLLSSVPASEIPVVLFPGADKLIHSGLYFTLAWLLHRSLERQTRSEWIRHNALFFSITAAVCYGWIDESYQATIPGRDSSSGDMIADAFGSILYA
ncbi:MAG: VanZ family protein, partial [Ignavibacteria bacterium]|nr:VanZ family protein [Ignavibacteria bacterium]